MGLSLKALRRCVRRHAGHIKTPWSLCEIVGQLEFDEYDAKAMVPHLLIWLEALAIAAEEPGRDAVVEYEARHEFPMTALQQTLERKQRVLEAGRKGDKP